VQRASSVDIRGLFSRWNRRWGKGAILALEAAACLAAPRFRCAFFHHAALSGTKGLTAAAAAAVAPLSPRQHYFTFIFILCRERAPSKVIRYQADNPISQQSARFISDCKPVRRETLSRRQKNIIYKCHLWANHRKKRERDAADGEQKTLTDESGLVGWKLRSSGFQYANYQCNCCC
jgi:hypothetical protein